MQVRAAENFRANLRTALANRELSQREFAESLGMSHPYINRVLKGTFSPPLKTCERMADSLGLSVGELILDPREFNRRQNALV